MRQMKSFLIVAILMAVSVAAISAQTTGTATASVTIQAVSLLTVSTDADPTFVVSAPGAAGQMPLITPAGDPTYLQYTTVVSTLEPLKLITASCDDAMLPGLKMDIWAVAPTGTGGVGTAVAGGLEVTSTYVADTAANLIMDITSCATGSGTTQGPAVYYTLSIDAATFEDMIVTGATVFTITFSLVDA